ncbi:MAG: hypothetical protein CMJ94_05105 [Planctomycetes bacterium]|nr:hypothetical protein [Planctomycetota bacterium]
MFGFRPTSLLRGTALALCLSVCSTLASAQESFPPPRQEADPSAAEVAARDAWKSLQAEVDPPRNRTRAAFEAYLGRMAQAIEDFAAQHAGTAASFEAQHELALMEIHALRKVESGIARMEKILTDSAGWKGPAPDGLRLDLPNYVFVLALALADLERFERAEALLKPIAADEVGGPRTEQAKRLLERVQARKRLQIGLEMPDFVGPRHNGGGEWRLRDFRGKVVLVQFWATWSRPCAQEMPQIAALQQQLGGENFTVLGVSLDDDRREGRVRLDSYLETIGLDAPQVYEGKGWEGAIPQQFALRAIPANFLLDAQGVIRGRNLRGAELRAAVEALLPEQED